MRVDLMDRDALYTDVPILEPTGRWRVIDVNCTQQEPVQLLAIECVCGLEEEKIYEQTFFSKYFGIGKGNLVYKETNKPKIGFIREDRLYLRYTNDCGE